MDYEKQAQAGYGRAIGGISGRGNVDVRAMSAPETCGPGISGQIERLDQVVQQAEGILANMMDILKRVDGVCGDLCGASEPTPIVSGAANTAVSAQGGKIEPATLISRLGYRSHQLNELLMNIQLAQGSIVQRLSTIREYL